ISKNITVYPNWESFEKLEPEKEIIKYVEEENSELLFQTIGNILTYFCNFRNISEEAMVKFLLENVGKIPVEHFNLLPEFFEQQIKIIHGFTCNLDLLNSTNKEILVEFFNQRINI